MRMPDENETNLVCPVCGMWFIRNDDTKYIANGGYTCSWDCFLAAVKKKYQKEEDKQNGTL